MDQTLKWLPAVMAFVALVAGGAVAQNQISKNTELAEENEDAVREVQRSIIIEQSNAKLARQQLSNDQQALDTKLDQIIKLIEEK